MFFIALSFNAVRGVYSLHFRLIIPPNYEEG